MGHLSEFQGERWERWERWDYMRTLDLDNEVKVIDLQAIPTLGVFALFSLLLQQNAASCLRNAGMGCSSLWASSLGTPSVSLVPRSHFHAALVSSFLFFSLKTWLQPTGHHTKSPKSSFFPTLTPSVLPMTSKNVSCPKKKNPCYWE